MLPRIQGWSKWGEPFGLRCRSGSWYRQLPKTVELPKLHQVVLERSGDSEPPLFFMRSVRVGDDDAAVVLDACSSFHNPSVRNSAYPEAVPTDEEAESWALWGPDWTAWVFEDAY